MKCFPAAAALALIASADAFSPLQSRGASNGGTLTTEGTALHQSTPTGSGREEKTLREELSMRNTAPEDDDAKFGVLDGANMEGAFTEDATPKAIATDDSSSLQVKMERMVQPRSYPLFILEKAAEFVESSLYDATSFLREPKATDKVKKERIVVLGTGWGAHSLLKGIDTDLYDVTVISPRNFFLFTPMLAGASVGTVEYRSITEPIREV